jgi:hypothetical protein
VPAFYIKSNRSYSALSTQVSCRQYEKGDETGIVKLLVSVFDSWPQFNLESQPLDHWRWKYERDHINQKVIAISESDGRIVGVNHAFPVNIKIGEAMTSCYQATDLAIHPDYRGMKLYPKMSEIKTRLHNEYNSSLNYGVTGNPRVIAASIKAGRLGFPKQIASLLSINDVDLHYEIINVKYPEIVKKGVKVLQSVKRIARPRFREVIHSQVVHKFDYRYSSFWNQIRREYDFIIERSPEYLNLRYCDPRGGDYHIKSIEEAGEILGYIVLRINRYNQEYPEGHVVDFLTYPDRLDVAESLLSDAISFFQGNNINSIRYWVVAKHPYEELFKRFGFINTRKQLRVNLHPMNNGSDWAVFMNAPANRLHFQYGDSDWI